MERSTEQELYDIFKVVAEVHFIFIVMSFLLPIFSDTLPVWSLAVLAFIIRWSVIGVPIVSGLSLIVSLVFMINCISEKNKMWKKMLALVIMFSICIFLVIMMIKSSY